MQNHLQGQTSPYLLQHAENPVDWYPWGDEAFSKARVEDKPVFLSIGYSTCHWCHVMAHESFEDDEVAELLNRHFVSIKVDREERPDIDSIYMSVCQAFTGSGGWPTSIFMTADQKPFFAGTYFPKSNRYGAMGFTELLAAIAEKWDSDRASLLSSAESAVETLRRSASKPAQIDASLLQTALRQYKRSYDKKYGGFGNAPKFPTPHNLLFLMTCHQKYGDAEALQMAEKTLRQMYAGGLFDHIGYGFCRYSTDRYFLVPHFEKMLYDNALLMLAYCKAYEITKNPLYMDIAEKTAFYILHEMTSEDGGFYSAQDADSDGEEGGYYLFAPQELTRLLGDEDGKAFNRYYGITDGGLFSGKSVPNLLNNDDRTDRFEPLLPTVRTYRRSRSRLSVDDKLLTAWNALMIAALCALYRITRKTVYLDAAKRAQQCVEKRLCERNVLYASYRDGKRGSKGFLDDYANYAFALLALYHATLDENYLARAQTMVQTAITDFFDEADGGFYLYGSAHETLILRPRESYDGATPSGNSMMAHTLVRLGLLAQSAETEAIFEKQLRFMCGEAEKYPMGYGMFLTALSDRLDPPQIVTAVYAEKADIAELPFLAPLDSVIRILAAPADGYPLVDGKTTYYVCRGNRCLPPVNDVTQWDKSQPADNTMENKQ